VSREHPLAPHRVLLVVVIIALAAVALLAVRGPDWYKRAYYYPLRFEQEIEAAAMTHEIDPYLIAAVIDTESGFEEDRVSEKGAVGLMQVMPGTADEVAAAEVAAAEASGAVSSTPLDVADPADNVRLGTAYLAELVERYRVDAADEDLALAAALAGYNAGPTKADAWIEEHASRETSFSTEGFIEGIDFAQTRHYVRKVLEARAEYEQLYPDAFEDAR
jgi:soluble lytic murein transglycosylase